MGELRRHVFVFVGPSRSKDDEHDLAEGLKNFASKILHWQLESAMNLPLTTKVKIDTIGDST